MTKKIMNIKKLLVLFVAITLVTSSCNDQDDNLFSVPANVEIQDFAVKAIKRVMNEKAGLDDVLALEYGDR